MEQKLERILLLVVTTVLALVLAFAPFEKSTEASYYVSRKMSSETETESSSKSSTKMTSTSKKSSSNQSGNDTSLPDRTVEEWTDESFDLMGLEDLENLLGSMAESKEESSKPESQTPGLESQTESFEESTLESQPESSMESEPEDPVVDYSPVYALAETIATTYGVSVSFDTAAESEEVGFDDADLPMTLLQNLSEALDAQVFDFLQAASIHGYSCRFILVNQELDPVSVSMEDTVWTFTISATQSNLTYELAYLFAELSDYLLGEVTELSVLYELFIAYHPADFVYGSYYPEYCWGTAVPEDTYFLRYAQQESVICDRATLYALECSANISDEMDTSIPVMQKLEILLYSWNAYLLP